MVVQRVLIVDDDQALGSIYFDKLSSSGLDVRYASGGNDALVHLESWRPEVILLDLNMPDMNGYELMGELTKRSISPAPQVIILSSNSDYLSKKRSAILGAARYLVKSSISLPELINIVQGRELEYANDGVSG